MTLIEKTSLSHALKAGSDAHLLFGFRILTPWP